MGLAYLAAIFVLHAPGAQADSVWNSSGFGGTGIDAFNTYNSIAYSPFRQLHEPGPIVRGTAKNYFFKYDIGIAENVVAENHVTGIGIEFEAGWQFVRENWRASVFGGAAWRKFTYPFEDPGNKFLNKKWAATFAAEGDYAVNEWVSLSANVQVWAGFDELWLEAKAFTPLWFGPSAGLSVAHGRGASYSQLRAGSIISGWQFYVPYAGLVFLTAEAGVQWELKDKKASPYAGIHTGIALY
ncbi:MAG: cellulose biosynthesis protein BcsS [Hyphomicrobiales bacterium]